MKEFDLEQTADVWLVLDLQRSAQVGAGDDSTVEVGVRVAAAIAERAIEENRAVALTTTGSRVTVLPPDRGPRQRQKVLQLLAAVEGDGETPLLEALVAALPLLRRGMSVIVITGSTEPGWVRPLATLRPRGIGCQVIWLDPAAFTGGGGARGHDRGDGHHGGHRHGRAGVAQCPPPGRRVRPAHAPVPPGVPYGEFLVG